MNPIRITPETMQSIITHLKLACDSEKDFACHIIPFDNSLKARQRALANIWYGDIARERGETVGESEAFCKYHWGFRIRCENDPDLGHMIRRMLDPYEYEKKLKIIEIYRQHFPILRDDGGMNTEQIGRYLTEIQRNMGREGIFLTSPNEKELLNCREANK